MSSVLIMYRASAQIDNHMHIIHNYHLNATGKAKNGQSARLSQIWSHIYIYHCFNPNMYHSFEWMYRTCNQAHPGPALGVN